ncbi:hypothetical protein L2E82_08066 [Cichorium intybus]|uniref:Uncharacterized protein n=1 Tax=Cichorium intybus TaxID=13427 RepID=A0ACB9G6K4_CICIN|nr:hypothetical protein L2E82_08066 [Cichorium intybus]
MNFHGKLSLLFLSNPINIFLMVSIQLHPSSFSLKSVMRGGMIIYSITHLQCVITSIVVFIPKKVEIVVYYQGLLLLSDSLICCSMYS